MFYDMHDCVERAKCVCVFVKVFGEVRTGVIVAEGMFVLQLQRKLNESDLQTKYCNFQYEKIDIAGLT
jgi:hypothetical protein